MTQWHQSDHQPYHPCISVNYKDDDDDDLNVLGSAWVGQETIKELEHISIGRKTNISNTSNIHNLSQSWGGHTAAGGSNNLEH